jgi:hypothetical protein
MNPCLHFLSKKKLVPHCKNWGNLQNSDLKSSDMRLAENVFGMVYIFEKIKRNVNSFSSKVLRVGFPRIKNQLTKKEIWKK